MKASRTGAFYDKEILKYPVGLEAVKNVVLDATAVTANADGRLVVEAGTVLVDAGDNKVKPAADSGVEASDVVGILAHTLEFFDNSDSDFDLPGAAFFWNCIFDSSKLINYSGNAANVKTALSSCAFE